MAFLLAGVVDRTTTEAELAADLDLMVSAHLNRANRPRSLRAG